MKFRITYETRPNPWEEHTIDNAWKKAASPSNWNTIHNTEWKTKYRTKTSMSSVVNLVYRCHNSGDYELLKFEIAYEDTWIEYEMPWRGTHASVKEKVGEITEFHKAFYEELL